MTLNLTMPDNQPDMKPRITVFGVGGAGGNAVNNMIDQNLDGCEFVVANTDAQALAQSKATSRIQMGARVTEGLGAGARPAVGASAAEESIEEIVDHLAGVHMAFITAGMGGGTGTGAAPIIAQAARELGVLTVGVVTKPFQFEGAKRMRQADEGIEALQKVVDTLIIIPNQNLFRLANEKTTFTEAFGLADDVLYQGVKGVTDLMVRPGLINLDFADVRAVMNEMGKAMMGTGEAEGENRAIQAAEKAIANPLLDEISLKGARGVLINITGGYDLTLFELDEAANRIREEVDPEANIIVGSTLDTNMGGLMRVSVVATGMDLSEMNKPVHAPVRRSLRDPVAIPIAKPEQAAAASVQEPMRLPELTLFEGFDATAAADMGDSLFDHDGMDDAAGIPIPAYVSRPAAAGPMPQPRVQATGAAEMGEYVAPKPALAGTPSPEALARLRAAIHKEETAGQHAPTAQQPAMRRAAMAPAAAAPTHKPRFGINNLINRMTGHSDDGPAPVERRQPPVNAGHTTYRGHDDGNVDPDQERIEIPAFLRRQAN